MHDRFDHTGFIASLLERYSILMAIPAISDQQYVHRIVECLNSREAGYSLLAMSMAAQLVEHCHDTADYEPLLALSDQIQSSLLAGSDDYDLVLTARELRSALFWGYLRLGHTDVRMLKSASRLFSAMTGCNVESALASDAVLSHGNFAGGFPQENESQDPS